jgi:hypothetical protein
MLFALPGYQFPYTVMNRCPYLMVKEINDDEFVWEGLLYNMIKIRGHS